MATITHKRVFHAPQAGVPASKLVDGDLVKLSDGRYAAVKGKGAKARLVRPRTQVAGDYTKQDEYVVVGRVEPLTETRAQFLARVTAERKPRKASKATTRKAQPKATSQASRLDALEAKLDALLDALA